jgi:hypothetical protein
LSVGESKSLGFALGTASANQWREISRSSRSGSPLLEALPAENRPALRRLKGNGGFLAADGTVGASFHSGVRPISDGSQGAVFSRFAGLTTFGLVLKLLVVEEELFSGREDEVSATVNTLQNLVPEFHGELLLSVRDP